MSRSNTHFNLATGFYQHAISNPDKLALVINDHEHTYGELAANACEIAEWIRTKMGPRSARFGLLAERTKDGFEGVLGIAWAGACYVPINPKFPVARILSIIHNSLLDGLIVGQNQLELLNQILPDIFCNNILVLDRSASIPATCDYLDSHFRDSVPSAPTLQYAESPAYLMFTSGTTGDPKGIICSQSAIATFFDVMQKRHRIQPSDRMSQVFEFSFDASLFDIFMSLSNGASLHVLPKSQAMLPANFIRDQQLSVWFSVPSTITLLEQTKRLDDNLFPNLRLSIFGGEALTSTALKAWRRAANNSRIDNIYGPTEAAVTCFIQECDLDPPVTPTRKTIAIGKPHFGTYAEILGEDQQFLATNATGEIVISGEQIAIGYWNDRQLNAEKFVELTHPSHGLGTWYRTGDLGYRDENDVFHLLGRLDNQVKVNGMRVELEEIETHLREVFETDQVAAVTWADKAQQIESLVAFISGSDIDIATARKQLSARLPAPLLPKRFIYRASLPQTLNNKIDRKSLIEELSFPDHFRAIS